MAHKDRLALDHLAAEGMPRMCRDVNGAEGAMARHAWHRSQPKPLPRDHSDGEVREGGKRWMGLHPAGSALVTARGESEQVSIRAGIGLQEGMHAPVEDPLGEVPLQATKVGESAVMLNDVIRAIREGGELFKGIVILQGRLACL